MTPYRGVHPFRYADRRFFFGRETAIEELVINVVLYRLVVLFGESGAGKSSVINAGLIPVLEQKGFRPERLRVSPAYKDLPILIERIQAGNGEDGVFLPSIFLDDRSNTAKVDERTPCSIDRFFSSIHESDRESTPLLIFDQFEELFTLFNAKHDDVNDYARLAQSQILNTIFEIANDQLLKVKILIIIREDFWAKLEILSKRYPQVFDHYVRLSHLNQEGAKNAIVGPFDNHNPFPSKLTNDLADYIIQQLSADDLHGQVHATQLQIVCDQLWRQYAFKRAEISNTEFEEAGGIKGILAGYFTSELAKLGPAHKVQAIQVLGNLITDSDTRDIVSKDKLRGILQSQDTDRLDSLDQTLKLIEDLRIINRTQQRDNLYYEIASEYLINPIKEEKQRLIENYKLKRQRRRWRWILIAVIVAGIMISVVSYKLHSVWLENQPWGYLNNLASGSIHSLKGNFASIGRSTEAFSNTIDLKPNLISRMHLWLVTRKQLDQSGSSWLPNIQHDIVAIDMRSLNGTTINAQFLPYGSFGKLNDDDIITLAGIAPFRFSQMRIPRLPPPSGWGILIDGASKTAHSLSGSRHILSLNAQGKLIVGNAETADSFLTVAHKDGRVTIASRRTDRDLWTTMRLGDYTYVRCKIPPGRDFTYFDAEKFYNPGTCEILSGRRDLNDITRTVHDLSTVTYTYGDVSFQIVQIVSDLEASPATN
jgi:hypothetical protein